MSLLEKFNSVEITADTRISEEDRRFCMAQKNAYDHARKALKTLAEQIEVLISEQKNFLVTVEPNLPSDHCGYFGSIDSRKYIDELQASHHMFIGKLVRYFHDKYNVTIEKHDIEEALFPQKPKERGWSYDPGEWKAYNRALNELSLEYTDILDQIFIQLGGFSFQDKAVNELKEASRAAAWNSYNGTKRYEQKKSVLTFPGYSCSFDSWHEEYYHGEHEIKLTDSIKSIIRSIIYFEYGILKPSYTPLDVLLGYDWKTYETELNVSMEKIKSVKCFKNGRVDFRFTSEAYAREFAEQFL